MADKRRGASAREKSTARPRWDLFPQPKQNRQRRGERYHFVKSDFSLASLSAKSGANGDVRAQIYHIPGEHPTQPPVQKPAGAGAVMSCVSYVHVGFRVWLLSGRRNECICQDATGPYTGRVISLLAIPHMVRTKFPRRLKISFKNRLDKYLPRAT